MKNNGQNDPYISVVVPLYNEIENVSLLYNAVRDAMESMEISYEMLFVDDGSTDGTAEKLKILAEKDTCLRAVLFRRNFGQSAAMGAGFRRATGEVVVAMDGDLQNDPADIPKLISVLNEGYDVVSGWRKNRKDKLIIRKVPSRIANRLICSITDVDLHDTGCSLKAFRREVIEGIRLYGELHRFIPALARVEGARISEVVVNHRARQFGESKYNITRTFRVLMDLSSLNLFLKYLRNPLRFFGKIGLWLNLFGLLGLLWAAYLVGVNNAQLVDVNVLITMTFLLWVAGFQFIFFGLVATLIVKTGKRRGVTLAPLFEGLKGNHHDRKSNT